MRGCLIFIESNSTGTGALFFGRAAALGFEPVLVSVNPGRYPMLAGHRSVRTVDRSADAMLAALAEARIEPASMTGIWSSSDAGVEPAARLARRLGRAHADPDAVARCRDKYAARVRLAGAGVAGPEFGLALNGAEAAEAARALRGPAIVKPRASTGSIGVRLCLTPDEAGRHAATLLADVDRGTALGVIVESYVRGPEYSVEMFDGAAVGVTRKHLGAPPRFIETGHDFPSPGSGQTLSDLADAATRAVRALGLTKGPAHAELRLGEGGPMVIEVNPRLAGGMIPELVRRSHGIDLIETSIRFACALAYDLRPARAQAASIRFLCRPTEAPVAAVGGVDDARRLPGVVQVMPLEAGLNCAGPVADFRDRLAFVIAEGRNADQSAARADAAIGHLHPAPRTASKGKHHG